MLETKFCDNFLELETFIKTSLKIVFKVLISKLLKDGGLINSQVTVCYHNIPKNASVFFYLPTKSSLSDTFQLTFTSSKLTIETLKKV